MASEIFYIEEDTSMRVHLLEGCVDNADKVADRVKSHGGSICAKARFADVILVNPDQVDSVPAELRKTPLLDPRWVNKCIKAGRALMEEDNWAGSLITPISDNEANPQVPTPRITPDQYGHRQSSPNSATASTSTNMMPYPHQFAPGPNSPFLNGQNMPMMPMNNSMQFPGAADPQLSGLIYDMMTMGTAGFSVPGHGPNPMLAPSASAPAQMNGGQHARSASVDAGLAKSVSMQVTPHGPVDTSSILKDVTFYVQHMLLMRKKLVQDIKAMGGKVSKDPETADFVILSERVKDFKRMMKAAHAAQRTVVGVNFVGDCMQKGRLLPPTNYAIHLDSVDSDESMDTADDEADEGSDEDEKPLAQRPRAKKRKSDVAKDGGVKKKVKVETASPAKKNQTGLGPKAKITSTAPSKVVAGSSKGEHTTTKTSPTSSKATKQAHKPPPSSDSDDDGPPKVIPPSRRGRLPANTAVYDAADRSPSPEPPARSSWKLLEAAPTRTGLIKYRYTPEEQKYMEEYIFHLRKYDPEMSKQAIGKKLEEKMPNHTRGAWVNAMASKLGPQYEEASKRAAIYHRKLAAEGRSASSKPAPAPTQSKAASNVAPAVAAAPAPTVSDSAPGDQGKTDWDDDMAAVLRFFIHEGGDENSGEDPDEVWKRLDQRVKCKSEPSWSAFWDKYGEKVNERYEAETGQVDDASMQDVA